MGLSPGAWSRAARRGAAREQCGHTPTQGSGLLLFSRHPNCTSAEPQVTPFTAKANTSPSPPSAELRPSQLTFLTGEGKRKNISKHFICLLCDSSLLPLPPCFKSTVPGVYYGYQGGRGNCKLILPPSPMTVADVQINENKNSTWDEVLATACPRGSP